jgi:TetR/AcrR family transcriptional repressor of nem operon
MGRVSKQQALRNREQVVASAARLFLERGVQDVSVTDLMAEAGLTHGGFYRHFASKEALVAEAVGHAFADRAQLLEDLDARGDHEAARREFVEKYLSAEHRDSPGAGCPAAGFSGDLAHEEAGGDAHAAYAEGIETYGRWLAEGESPEDLAAVATLIGAVVLARATSGTPVSDRILAAARDSLQR